ncbi:tRNA pseudouridine(38-40) synthase TruA [Lachnoclostridium sp. An196]|uniref:tRNA pseudouridine(38-40) synthase TruA n=1 Tax=Lachnoclostridium sp. An196 TaxID=1965583 RepID=UPI000B371B71|nr:tRNA pseudouridine(38-40) synthase TruA [Lachnoclostridium sp. An196]OUP17033.1 tRNA pseudouridine(38-40) synthase TruA [Lachnoclostridium sp. An196]
MNYKAVIQYEGTRYRGWQVQGNTDQTIQGKLETLLGRMAGEPVEVHGSGRTDGGVHAAGQVISFRCKVSMSPQEIRGYMNRYLPEDIAVLSVEEAAPRFHARLNAVRKTYVYTIWNSEIPNVFGRRFMTRIEEPLDVERMRKAAGHLCGEHDFLAFSSLNPRRFKKSTVRRLDEIRIEQKEAAIRICFTGDGFLYHMVRILTGTLVEVGLGLRSPEEMDLLLKSGSRADAGRLMPPEGLTLLSVEYS